MASRLDDLLDPEFRFKPRIAGRRGRGEAHRVTSLRAALSGLARTKPYDVGRARENSRRCVVKGRYVPMRGGGQDAARLHLGYLERNGVERDGSPGHLYGADASFDKTGFAEPLEGEKNQFRFIVSPEDGRDVDLQVFTRELMAQAEKDLGWNGTLSGENGEMEWGTYSTFEEAIADVREAARWYEKVGALGFGVHAWY